MKKFNATKMMALLMALCLITSTFVGSTLAKYTTKATGEDTARVARFGVAITANGNTFATNYDNTVETLGSLDLVAPGTNGTMASMAITGTPEVDVSVDYTGAFDIDDTFWTVDGTYYCPLIVTVEGTAIDGATFTSATDFEAAVNNAINGADATYEANTDLSGANVVDVAWSWPFYVSDDNDVKDTALGDKAAVSPDTKTVTLKITTTVTQID